MSPLCPKSATKRAAILRPINSHRCRGEFRTRRNAGRDIVDVRAERNGAFLDERAATESRKRARQTVENCERPASRVEARERNPAPTPTPRLLRARDAVRQNCKFQVAVLIAGREEEREDDFSSYFRLRSGVDWIERATRSPTKLDLKYWTMLIENNRGRAEKK